MVNRIIESRRDLTLVRRSIREGWPTAAETRKQIIAELTEILADPAISRRLAHSVMLTVETMDRANNRDYLAKLTAVLNAISKIRSRCQLDEVQDAGAVGDCSS